MSGVAVVTDSTSSLAPSLADRAGLFVVPLQVIVDGASRPESLGPDAGAITPGAVAAALREGRSVSTSRPSAEAFQRVYAEAAERGAGAIVSVHLSAAISGTCDAAELAARSASVPVIVVDSTTVGSGCGFASLWAAEVAAAGASAEEVADVARARATSSVTYFCVENLDYLRRGGRIGAAQALLGSALAVKPLLTVSQGKIAPYERVRTMSRALARLEELAGEALSGRGAAGGDVAGGARGTGIRGAGAAAGVGEAGVGGVGDAGADVAVLHLDNRSAADRLARALGGRSGVGVPMVTEVSAVLGVHCGPGTVGVVVSPRG